MRQVHYYVLRSFKIESEKTKIKRKLNAQVNKCSLLMTAALSCIRVANYFVDETPRLFFSHFTNL